VFAPSRSVGRAINSLLQSALSQLLILSPLSSLFFPLVRLQAGIMRRVPSDEAANVPVVINADFQRVLDAAQARRPVEQSGAGAVAAASVSMESIERFAFYERAKKCFAVVITGEKRLYGNILVKKGVIRADE
jgi:L-fucose mutarotase